MFSTPLSAKDELEIDADASRPPGLTNGLSNGNGFATAHFPAPSINIQPASQKNDNGINGNGVRMNRAGPTFDPKLQGDSACV